MSNRSTSIVAVRRALARIALSAAAEDEEGPGTDDAADDNTAKAPPGAPNNTGLPPDAIDESPHMDPEDVDPEEVDEDDEVFTLEDVIKCFLRANPTPTDDQVHKLSELLGLSFEDFEATIFKKFGEVIKHSVFMGPSETDDGDDEDEGTEEDEDEGADPEDLDEDELQASDELDVQDDIDMFVVAYMMFNPAPSDEQIHALAFVIDLTKEEMEQRIYRMLGSYLQVGDESGTGDDGEEDEDKDDTDEDGEDLDEDAETEPDDDAEDDEAEADDDADAEDPKQE